MNKSDIKSGNVFAVPLLMDFGFAYVKLIQSEDCIPKPPHMVRLVKLYNRFDNEVDLSVNLDYFETDDILIAPIMLNGTPQLRGNDKWIHLGDCKLTEEDKTVPHIHEAYQGGVYQKDYIDQLEGKGAIYCLTELGISGENKIAEQFSQVRHLRSNIYSSAKGIQIQLTFFWMDRLGHSSDHLSGIDGVKDFVLNWGANIIRSNNYDISDMPKVERLKMKKGLPPTQSKANSVPPSSTDQHI